MYNEGSHGICDMGHLPEIAWHTKRRGRDFVPQEIALMWKYTIYNKWFLENIYHMLCVPREAAGRAKGHITSGKRILNIRFLGGQKLPFWNIFVLAPLEYSWATTSLPRRALVNKLTREIHRMSRIFSCSMWGLGLTDDVGQLGCARGRDLVDQELGSRCFIKRHRI